MSGNRGYKEVNYKKYCETCKYKDVKEYEEPCNECLNNSVNLYSHKPTNHKERGNENG